MSLNELLVVNDASKPWANINVHDIHAYGTLTVDGGMIITGDTTFAGNILPDSTAANRNVGSSSKLWNHIYSTTANLQNIQNLSTSNFVIKNNAGTEVLHIADTSRIVSVAVELDVPTIAASTVASALLSATTLQNLTTSNFVFNNHAGSEIYHVVDSTGALVMANGTSFTSPTISATILENLTNANFVFKDHLGDEIYHIVDNTGAFVMASGTTFSSPTVNVTTLQNLTTGNLVVKNHAGSSVMFIVDNTRVVNMDVELSVPTADIDLINGENIQSRANGINLALKSSDSTVVLTIDDTKHEVNMALARVTNALNIDGSIFIGASATPLSTYTTSDVNTTAVNIWASPPSVTFSFSRIGRIVTMNFTTVSATASGAIAAISISGTPVPAAFRPTYNVALPIFSENSGNFTSGMMIVTSGGNITIYVDAEQSTFSGVGASGFLAGCVNWTVT